MPAESLLKVVMPASIFFIMMAMGLELTVRDFRRVFVEPRAVLTGVIGQILLLPAFALGLVLALPLPDELAIGLVILAACPGGAMSNVISYLARADTALSISMTAISSLLNIVSLPLLANLALHIFADEHGTVKLPIGMTMGQLAMLTLVPVGIGMLLRHKKQEAVDRALPKVKKGATTVFILIVVGLFAAHSENLVDYISSALMHAAIMGIASTFMGYGLARVVKLPPVQRITIAVEFCIQNVAMATLVAVSLLEKGEYGIFAGIYGIVCLMVILPTISVLNARREKRADEA